MPDVIEEKMPWDDLATLTAFIGVIATLAASFGYLSLTAEQVAGISTIIFVAVMVARKYGTSDTVTFHKEGVVFVKMQKAEYQAMNQKMVLAKLAMQPPTEK
jgi:hypothetical protein